MEKPLKWGETFFFFPEHPEHEFNGCSANSCGIYNEKIINGLKCRNQITTFPFNEYNQKNYPWKGEIILTPETLNLTPPVLVRLWSNHVMNNTEFFYLTN